MGETLIKKLGETYQLTNGKCYIVAEILVQSGRITLENGHGDNDFVFKCSTPEMVYAIGTLIRDAADLVNTPE